MERKMILSSSKYFPFFFFYYPSGIIFIKKNTIKTNFKKFSSILHSFLTRPSSKLGFWVLTGSPGSILLKKSKRRRFSKKKKSAGYNQVFERVMLGQPVRLAESHQVFFF
jgi:hypothetical protein